jgi:hypothetical protein
VLRETDDLLKFLEYSRVGHWGSIARKPVQILAVVIEKIRFHGAAADMPPPAAT